MNCSGIRFLLVGVLIALNALVTVPWNVMGQEPAGKVVAVEGVVWIFPGGAEQATEAEPGSPIYAGDIVEAEPESRAKLLMMDDSVLTISAGTRLSLDEYQLDRIEASRRSVLSLIRGKVRFLVNKLLGYRSRYEIQSPTAVMGVRGTSGVMWMERAKDDPDKIITRVLATEGVLEVRSALPGVEGVSIVEEGFICDVMEGLGPTDPLMATPEVMERALEGTVVQLVPGQTFLMDGVTVTALEKSETRRQAERKRESEKAEGAGASAAAAGPGAQEGGAEAEQVERAVEQEVESVIGGVEQGPAVDVPAERPGGTGPQVTQDPVSTEPIKIIEEVERAPTPLPPPPPPPPPQR